MSQKFAHLDAEGFVIAFYDDEWHGDAIPAGSVAITDEDHVLLLEGQSAGKRMKLCEKGLPLLVDRVVTDDDLAALLRAQRDSALAATDWLVQRHMDESVFSAKTTLTTDQIQELGTYRQALRDLPAADGFPRVNFPIAPDFIGV